MDEYLIQIVGNFNEQGLISVLLEKKHKFELFMYHHCNILSIVILVDKWAKLDVLIREFFKSFGQYIFDVWFTVQYSFNPTSHVAVFGYKYNSIPDEPKFEKCPERNGSGPGNSHAPARKPSFSPGVSSVERAVITMQLKYFSGNGDRSPHMTSRGGSCARNFLNEPVCKRMDRL